ncbi:ABC transporter permease [Azospirillum sp. ST 5-10]|uniref:ABC transporter permease n=1 Tax=unclassified Azospirillum TaxID=2630922 RepID=UPI003F49D445
MRATVDGHMPPPVAPPARPEIERDILDASNIGDVERPLSAWERLTNVTAVRRGAILVVLAVVWQLYAASIDNPLMFPTFGAMVEALWDSAVHGELLQRCLVSIQVLLLGYGAGVALAAVLTTLAVSTRIGTDILATLTAMFNPLPAIALLPLALLWFGLGVPSLIFVLIHSVLWPVSLNTHSGFLSVSETLRMAGRNYGLKGVRYVFLILIPAAFPAILAGLKIGWAFAWRTLIAAELVFGVSSGSGGLGWFIFENRNQLEIANVFAGLTTVIIIGLLVESVVFRTIERATVQKWGMQR